jgi:hypothetical protein
MANMTTFDPASLYIQTPLKYKIRELLLLHSAEEIYNTMRSIFHEDYMFYQVLFDPPSDPRTSPSPPPAPTPAPPPTPAATSTPASEEEVQEEVKPVLRPSTKIRIVKKPQEPVLAEQEQPLLAEQPQQEATSEREKKVQIKKEQNEKVEKKFQELQVKGIDSYSLLTKDNLKKWVDTDKLTYTQIARDHVGLPADEIATIAKGFGIQSHIAKKRAVIIAGRKH